MQNTRFRFVPAVFLALTGIAYATPPTAEMPELPPNTPARCSAMFSELPGIAARVAVGNCLARDGLKDVSVTTANLETANALATAVAPGMAMLDNVIALGDPYYSMLAEDAKRDIYQGMAVRLRDTVPPGDKVMRVRTELLVANWLDNVAYGTVRITELAENHPDAANQDAVVSAITQRAEAESATQVATRSRRR